MDIVTFQFAGEDLSKLADRAFRYRVRGNARAAAVQNRSTGSRNNPAEVLPDHHRHGGMGGKVYRTQVQIEHPVPAFLAGFVNLPRREPADNANQEIKSPPARGDVGDESLDGGALGQIGFGAPQSLASGAGATLQCCPMFIGGIRHCHACSVSSQIKRYDAAQSARSTRNHGNSTLKVHKDSSHSRSSRETLQRDEGCSGGLQPPNRRSEIDATDRRLETAATAECANIYVALHGMIAEGSIGGRMKLPHRVEDMRGEGGAATNGQSVH